MGNCGEKAVEREWHASLSELPDDSDRKSYQGLISHVMLKTLVQSIMIGD
jgi:hypothetical protein